MLNKKQSEEQTKDQHVRELESALEEVRSTFFYRRFGFCLFLFGGRGEVWKSWRQLFVVTDFCLSFEERGGVNSLDFLWSLELFISCHSASIICKLILADFWPVKANWPFVNSQISLWIHYFSYCLYCLKLPNSNICISKCKVSWAKSSIISRSSRAFSSCTSGSTFICFLCTWPSFLVI